jgi:hypothetical protein
MEGQAENFTPRGYLHPQGITSPLGDKFTPGGQLRPWGSKFAPRGEVKNGPLNNEIDTFDLVLFVVLFF